MIINVRGVRYKIKIMDAEDPRLSGCEGICNIKTKEIFLAEKPPVSTFENVFWHEYFHAWLYESGIRDLDSHFEHVLIESLSDLLERLDTDGKFRQRL